MKPILGISIVVTTTLFVQALSISEIMSNPVGDDSGREWIEVYNNGSAPVDLSTLSISIKGGASIGVTLIQGNPTLPPGGYAVISSIVSASNPTSRFLDSALGYPSYVGTLLKTNSSISLVNTGVTSLDIKLQGTTVDSLSSYTPAGEGKTLSLLNGSFVEGMPTPGEVNQEVSQAQTATNSTSSDNQFTIARATPPSPDIVLYLPKDKLVVAGAETEFSVYAMTRGGKPIENLKASWAFGDGGEEKGTSTFYAYAYPGRYLARVEAGDSSVRGTGDMYVTVVPPEITIAGFSTGKYGSYIDINNPNEYDLDLSQWKLHIGGSAYPFPKNTVLPKKSITHISGKAMGFASTSIDETTLIKITFPNFEEVTHFTKTHATSSSLVVQQTPSVIKRPRISETKNPVSVLAPFTTSSVVIKETKDTRIADWVRSFFRKKG